MSTVTDLLEDYEAGRLDPGATIEEFSELIRTRGRGTSEALASTRRYI